MAKKNSKTSSCLTACPDCGSRLSTLDLGYSICYECGWSWTPHVHLRGAAPAPRSDLNSSF